MKALMVLMFGVNLAGAVVNSAYAIRFFMERSPVVYVSLIGVAAGVFGVVRCAGWLEREW